MPGLDARPPMAHPTSGDEPVGATADLDDGR